MGHSISRTERGHSDTSAISLVTPVIATGSSKTVDDSTRSGVVARRVKTALS
jgi:hypothetical protein